MNPILEREQLLTRRSNIEDALTRFYEEDGADTAEVLSATESEAYEATRALAEISHAVPRLIVQKIVSSLVGNLLLRSRIENKTE